MSALAVAPAGGVIAHIEVEEASAVRDSVALEFGHEACERVQLPGAQTGHTDVCRAPGDVE